MRLGTMRGFSLTVAIFAVTLGLGTAADAAPPVKYVLTSHVGWEVDKATKGKICTVASNDECQSGLRSAEPGGFEFPVDAAGAPSGDFYVADLGNHRVQKFNASGEFILMFGKEVNVTTHGDVCTAEEIIKSGVKCKAGVGGPAADALGEPQSIAVDPETEAVYVLDHENWRIDKYTPVGQLLWMTGREVNATKAGSPGATEAEKNLCVVASGDTCEGGVKSTTESTEKAAFNFEQGPGGLLTVFNHVLYVGDEHRIQEFGEEGQWNGEIKLPSAIVASNPGGHITALAADASAAYVVYQFQNVMHKLDITSGAELSSIELSATKENEQVDIRAIALDSAGRLAFSAREGGKGFGVLYDAVTGRLITTFVLGGISRGLGFNGKDELFAAIDARSEVAVYSPELVAEVITETADCVPGPEKETSDTFDCALRGKVNPFNVPSTEIWFEWGRTCAFGSSTAHQPIPTTEGLLPVSAVIEGLRPAATFCDRLDAVDQNVVLPEDLTGEGRLFETPAVSPKVLGEPSASFVTSSSAIVYGELNPENASTEYAFEYATNRTALEGCEGLSDSCPSVGRTSPLNSSLYGRTGATGEVTGLQPSTLYYYRLSAVNQGGAVTGAIGSLTTGLPPSVAAETSTASAIGTTTATVAGSVNPGGKPAVYRFELGVYAGANTQYTVIFSGSTEATTAAEIKSLGLTGLQPGTTYAYRISVSSGYGGAIGAGLTFTTLGLPSVLASPATPALLSVPNLPFAAEPKMVTVRKKCKRDFTINKHHRCVKVKKGKAHRASGRRRPRHGKGARK